MLDKNHLPTSEPLELHQMFAVMDLIQDGYIAVDPLQTVVYVNPAAEGLLGKPQSDLVGYRLFDVFPGSKSSVFAEKLVQVTDCGDPASFETSLVSGDQKNWFEFSLTCHREFISIVFRIPERNRWMEESLRKSENRYSTLLGAIPDQVMRLDKSGVCLSCKPADPTELDPTLMMSGKHLGEIFPTDVAKLFDLNIAACLADGEARRFEYALPQAGNVGHWQVMMAPAGSQEVLTVARNITAEIKAAETYEAILTAEREQRLLAEILAEVALALTAKTSLKSVLEEVLRQTQRLVPFRTAHIMLLKEDYLHIASWHGYRELGSEELVSNLVQPLKDYPLDAQVIESRQPLVIADTHQEPRWVVQDQTAWVRSHAVVPIVLGDSVLGILRLDANTTNAFSSQDVVRLQPLTNAAAIAMENARLYDQAQQEIAERRQIEQDVRRRNRELALLNQIIAASAASVEMAAILNVTCKEMALAFDMAEVSAALANNTEVSLTFVAEYQTTPLPSLVGQTFADNGLKNGLVDSLFSFKTPIAITDTTDDSRLQGPENPLVSRGIRALLLLPLVFENKVVGALQLAMMQPYRFSSQEINLALRVADQVSGVLVRTQLEQEHRRLSEAIEQSAESVVITDTRGQLQYVNPAFERITGYSRQEVMGKKLNFLGSGKHDRDFYGNLWQTISSGNVWHGRFTNKRKDGQLYIDEATISPVRSEQGAIVGYVGVQRDVTREIQLEEQYLQAQKMEAIGLLAGGVAHDFNNLLTVINGFAEMIQYEIPPENLHLQKLASRVRYSGARAAALVRQLLAFSRKEFVEPKTLNLNKIVSDTGKMLERLLEENIVLKTNLSPSLWSIKADPNQIEQIIMNLTVNARDAMPSGGLLTIDTQNQDLSDAYAAQNLNVKPGCYVQLTVTDNGVGMTEEVQDRIFEPFFTTKESGKGTGLGMATIFGIVKQYEGHILVYSEPNNGSTFRILLPAIESGSDGVAAPKETNAIPTGSETILVVEDEATVRDLAVYMLKRQGYNVLQASNGEDALKLAVDYSGFISLLLTDTVMPKMSGNVLAEKFQADFPNTKILFTSGYTDRNFFQPGMRESGVDFIPKPFSAAELARKVRSVLDS
ncbi:MAG: hypothetical protein Kow0031_13900 [Anaerolineae bacterium]